MTLTVEPAGGGAARDVDGRDDRLRRVPASGPVHFGIIHLPERDGLRFTVPEPLFWTEDLGGGALYVRLTQVQTVPTSEIEALSAAIESPDVTKVVFDLRHNPGGNNYTYPYLLAILQRIEQPMWVLTDRRTFSAASNLSTEIEQTTEARFAGEEMGGGLNFWDDVQFVELVNLPIPLSVGISTVYHQKSFAEDPRLTIEPDLRGAVPLRGLLRRRRRHSSTRCSPLPELRAARRGRAVPRPRSAPAAAAHRPPAGPARRGTGGR